MLRALLLLGIGLIVTGAVGAAPPDRPLPPKDAAKAMTLPKGFKATLFAGEPDVVQPIAFTFDDRGRLWVVECLSYPQWSDKPEGHDRVVIFEDTDGDGVFDKKTVFLDNGQNLTSIELGFGGVWLCSAPNLLFIPMKDGTDKPSGPPQVLLDGWDYKTIRHNIFNGLTWGPDGWLYGCHGITTPSHVGKPGTPDDKRTFVSCGVWRYHPTKKVFEIVCNGTTNPWGLDFDDYGEGFITNCVIAHLFHVIPGAHYDRMFGQDPNPYVYGLMKTCADHLHWVGSNWTEARGGPKHSDAGGGHAHVGCMVYLGDNWPDEYRNGVFMCNLHGNRINHDILERKGSGYVAHHGKDFLFANDPWFRGIAIKYGPDGGVFVTDWTDTGECHNYKEVDRTNGRIFKVTYGTPKPWKGDLSKLSDAELVKLQTHKNDWFVRHARRILQERAAAGKLAKETPHSLFGMLLEPKPERRLRALWTIHVTGAWPSGFRDDYFLTKTIYTDEEIAWWIRLYADDYTKAEAARLKFVYPFVVMWERKKTQLAFASIVSRLPAADRWTVVEALAKNEQIVGDANLPLMIWYGIEPLIPTDPKRAVALIAKTKLEVVREFISHRVASLPGVKEPLTPLLELLATTQDDGVRFNVLRGIEEALIGQRSAPLPAGWDKVYAVLSTSKSDQVRERATNLAVVFDDPKAFADLRATVSDGKANTEARERALRHLVFKAKPDLLPLLNNLLTDSSLAGAAVRGLATFNDPKTPEILLKHYAAFPEAVRPEVIATLSSRPAYAHALLDAVAKGTIPRAAISSFTARQLGGMKDKTVGEQLRSVWGTVRDPSKEKAALTAKFKKELSPADLNAADPLHGRLVFSKTCASCHRLFDDGGDVGPNLTGSQRSNLDYVLENVLDPSAVVAREYQMNVVTLTNGRVLNGIIKHENDRAVTLRTDKEAIVIPKNEIESRKVSKLSMMPDGLFDKLSREEVRDLVAYLSSPQQVPLPKP